MSTNPFDAFTGRRASAAEVQDLARRMDIVGVVNALDERVGEVEQGHADTMNFLGYEDLVPVDDGTPPLPPANLVVTPVPYRELDVTWDTPPATDYVVKSVMEITPSGGSPHTVDGTSLFAFDTGLAGGLSHSVRVKLVDRWDHESDWSAPVSATPLRTAAEEVDLSALAILGRLQGLLPNENLATIQDATKLAAQIISSSKLADGAVTELKLASDAVTAAKVALGAITEVKLADAAVTAAKVAAAAITGPALATGAITATKISDGAIETAKLAAGSVIASKIASDTITANEIAANAITAGEIAAGAVTTTKLAAGAVTANEIAAGAVTTTKLVAGAITANEIAAGAVTTAKLNAGAVTANELAANSITSTKIVAGAVLAQAMAVQDAAAMNLWVQDAAIQSAKIVSIQADKITTGTLSAATITLALSGKIQAGNTKLDAGGLSLLATGPIGASNAQVDQKITNTTHFGAFHFYDESGSFGHRGSVMRAEGNNSNIRSVCSLQASYNTTMGSGSAYLDVRSKNTLGTGAEIQCGPELIVDGDVTVSGTVFANSLNATSVDVWVGLTASLGQNGIWTMNHNFGALPAASTTFQLLGGGQYKPLPTGGASFGTQVEFVTTSQIRVLNLEASTWQFQHHLIRQ